MSVSYIANLKTSRMQAVIDRIDIGTAGTIEICTAGYAGVIVSIPIAKPSFTESAGVITLAGVPKSAAATLAGTNTAAVARIKASNGDVVVNSLTVGVGTGDVQLNSVSHTLGQTVSITAGTITHSA